MQHWLLFLWHVRWMSVNKVHYFFLFGQLFDKSEAPAPTLFIQRQLMGVREWEEMCELRVGWKHWPWFCGCLSHRTTAQSEAWFCFCRTDIFPTPQLQVFRDTNQGKNIFIICQLKAWGCSWRVRWSLSWRAVKCRWALFMLLKGWTALNIIK